jgi:hypothetical protein
MSRECAVCSNVEAVKAHIVPHEYLHAQGTPRGWKLEGQVGETPENFDPSVQVSPLSNGQ